MLVRAPRESATCSTAAGAFRRILTSVSSSAIRARAAASAADSTCSGVGDLTPRSSRSRDVQWCRQDWAMPKQAATSRTERPALSRSRARRRNSGG